MKEVQEFYQLQNAQMEIHHDLYLKNEIEDSSENIVSRNNAWLSQRLVFDNEIAAQEVFWPDAYIIQFCKERRV